MRNKTVYNYPLDGNGKPVSARSDGAVTGVELGAVREYGNRTATFWTQSNVAATEKRELGGNIYCASYRVAE